MNSKIISTYFLIIISLLGYCFLYFGIERNDFTSLIIGIGVLGIIYFYWLSYKSLSVRQVVVSAVLFRIVLLFGTPNFSDDYNRFLWDGMVIAEGENPYEKTPTQFIEISPNKSNNFIILYPNLNSKDYFTVYPPLNQFLFFVSAKLSNGNSKMGVALMKFFILLFEIGLIFLLFKMLRKLKMKENLAQIYALNPLVIIELTGNVHFEGVMLFFLMLGLYLILSNKLVFASIAIGLAISVKLIPLLFLPLLLPLLGFKKSIKVYIRIAVTSVILVLPFISQTLINNFSESVNLYFQSFEFNASIYYVLKSISYYFLDYKSSLIGTITPIIVFSVALFFTYSLYRKSKTIIKEKELFLLFIKYATNLLFAYYLLASTVHPWYVINLVVLSVFIKNRTFLLWSLLVFCSYFAYSNMIVVNAIQADFHQYPNYYYLIIIEYVLILFFFIFENRKRKHI